MFAQEGPVCWQFLRAVTGAKDQFCPVRSISPGARPASPVRLYSTRFRGCPRAPLTAFAVGPQESGCRVSAFGDDSSRKKYCTPRRG